MQAQPALLPQHIAPPIHQAPPQPLPADVTPFTGDPSTLVGAMVVPQPDGTYLLLNRSEEQGAGAATVQGTEQPQTDTQAAGYTGQPGTQAAAAAAEGVHGGDQQGGEQAQHHDQDEQPEKGAANEHDAVAVQAAEMNNNVVRPPPPPPALLPVARVSEGQVSPNTMALANALVALQGTEMNVGAAPADGTSEE